MHEISRYVRDLESREIFQFTIAEINVTNQYYDRNRTKSDLYSVHKGEFHTITSTGTS